MKRVLLGIALTACLPALPQDQPKIPQKFFVYRITGGYRVVAEDGPVINAIATSIETVGQLPVVRFKGNVEIKFDGVEILADEVDYHWKTGECEPVGNVHVKPLPVP